jgi:hypothetical protein
MIRYVGLDVHKQFIEACILDERGEVLFRGYDDRTGDRPALKKTDRVALEATTHVVSRRDPEPFVAIVVGNPLKTKASPKPRSKRTRSTPSTGPQRLQLSASSPAADGQTQTMQPSDAPPERRRRAATWYPILIVTARSALHP